MELDFSLANVNTIGVVGLGLIGGSYAKAYRENTNCVIYGTDKDEGALAAAIEDGTLNGELTDEKIPECDLLLVALYPEAIIEYVKSVADRIRPEAYVIDTGGLKRNVCKALFPVAADHGFTFIGGHPMAGKKTSGYKHSTGNLFKGASMILVPDDVHLGAGAYRFQRLHEESHRSESPWLLRRQLQGHDTRCLAERDHVDRDLHG